jgi:hypothetical protein
MGDHLAPGCNGLQFGNFICSAALMAACSGHRGCEAFHCAYSEHQLQCRSQGQLKSKTLW